ncbi:hypothetical protein QUG64_04060 [Acinetobacter lwoffii]|nr:MULTISPECIES: hypothetical protein [Acinetobacter]GEA64900.1 hypothetical protein AL1T_21780 [Acinetobacter lwoffii]
MLKIRKKNVMYELTPDIQAQMIVRSLNSNFTIAFPKSKSRNFPAALSLAKLADEFEEKIDGKAVYYISTFSINQKNCSLLIALLDLAIDWKGVHIFLDGKPLNRSRYLAEMLRCYRNSFRVKDHKAYCFEIKEDLGSPNYGSMIFELRIINENDTLLSKESDKKPTQWIYPCKQLSGAARFLNKCHPASLQDQLQAKAVEVSCDLCPNFNAYDLQELD